MYAIRSYYDRPCLLRIDELAGEEDVEGLLARHVPRDHHRRHGAEEPVADAVGREGRLGRGDRHVAGGDDLAARNNFV